jgi:hypothetical protein
MYGLFLSLAASAVIVSACDDDEPKPGEIVRCEASRCAGPAPLAPSETCKDGTVAGPACVKQASGTCAWTVLMCRDGRDGGLADASGGAGGAGGAAGGGGTGGSAGTAGGGGAGGSDGGASDAGGTCCMSTVGNTCLPSCDGVLNCVCTVDACTRCRP